MKTKRSSRPGPLRVWYIAPFGQIVTTPVAVIWYPDRQTHLIEGPHERSRKMIQEILSVLPDAEIEEINGIKGIAMTDPHWDGKQTFKCENCDAAHDVDENVATVLYQRFQATKAIQ